MDFVPSQKMAAPQTTPAVATRGSRVHSVYLNGEYLARNPLWHLEESAWKAAQIGRMLQKNEIFPTTVCDVGCGAGEVLRQLQEGLGNECKFFRV